MPTTLSIRFRCRGRTAASWTSLNEVLLDKELGLETDTGRFKFGDGSTGWNALAYSGEGGAAAVAWGSLTGTLADQTDLAAALASKVPTTRTINGIALSANVTLAASDVGADATGAAAAAQAHAVQRANHTGTQAISTVSGLQVALDAKADLVGGLVPSAQIPAIAITEYLGTVANQAAMLALAGQKGDWALRSDLGTTFIITGDDPTQLADWTQLNYPTAPVTSVNGQTGTVTLAKGDVGLGNVDNTSDANKPVSTATQTALDAKLGTGATAAAANALATARTIGGISFDGSANIEPGVSTVSVTTGRALALTDRNKELHQTHASPQTLSIPAQSSVTWVGPTTILILAHGAGTLTLDADTGVTLNGVSGGSVALDRYQNAVLRWISSDVWVVSGTSADVA